MSRLAADGAKVVISSRKQENVNRAVSELKSKGFQNVLGVKCHVGDGEDRNNLFKETVAKFGGLDILVSNAAVNPAVGMYRTSYIEMIIVCNKLSLILLNRLCVGLQRGSLGQNFRHQCKSFVSVG